jgi:hypothetical protein
MNPALRDLILGASSASTPSFSPADISGLALWLDAADASSITLDGSNNVEQWNDKSGNARHATQATALVRPNYIFAERNGLNVVRHTSANLAVVTANQSAETFYGSTRNEVTLFLVWKYTSGNAGVVVGKGGNAVFMSSSNVISQWNGTTYGSTAFAASTSWRSTVSRYDGPNGLHDSWANGTKVATQTNFTSLAVVAGSDYRLRTNNDAVSQNMDLAELLVFNRPLTDSEVGQMNTYLNSKWALP